MASVLLGRGGRLRPQACGGVAGPKSDRLRLQAQPIAGAGPYAIALDQVEGGQGGAQGRLQGAVDAGFALVEVLGAQAPRQRRLAALQFAGELPDHLAVFRQKGGVEVRVGAPQPALSLALTAGQEAVEGQFGRGHVQPLAGGAEAAATVSPKRAALVETVAQAYEGDLGQGDLGVEGVGQLVVTQGNDVVISRRVVKGGAAFEGCAGSR